MANLIYHGTVYNFDLPLLSKCKDRKDFGKGFYLSEDLGHARSIATKGYSLRGFTGEKYIYSYKIDVAKMRKLGINIHQFNSANYAWLEFIIKNRNMLDVEEYDVIIGPTADKSAQKSVADFYKLYGMGASNKEKDKLLQDLNITKYSKQYCFRTQKALDYLNAHFIERRSFV